MDEQVISEAGHPHPAAQQTAPALQSPCGLEATKEFGVQQVGREGQAPAKDVPEFAGLALVGMLQHPPVRLGRGRGEAVAARVEQLQKAGEGEGLGAPAHSAASRRSGDSHRCWR